MSVLLVSPTKNLIEKVEKCLNGFNGYRGTNQQIFITQSTPQIYNILMSEAIDIIFLENSIDQNDSEIIAGYLMNHENLHIVSSSQYTSSESSKSGKSDITQVERIDREAIQNSFFMYLGSKLDNLKIFEEKILKNILTALPAVIEENTGAPLVPVSVRGDVDLESVQDLSVLVTFKGLGVLGSFIITMPHAVAASITSKIIGIKIEDLDSEVVSDTLGELANQVSGKIQESSHKFNLKLDIVMQNVVSASPHLYISKSEIKSPVYEFSFAHTLGTVGVHFWNRIGFINPIGSPTIPMKSAKLCIRSNRIVEQIVMDEFYSLTGCRPNKTGSFQAPIEQKEGNVLFLCQMHESRTDVILILRFPISTVNYIVKKLSKESEGVVAFRNADPGEQISEITEFFEKITNSICIGLKPLNYELTPSATTAFYSENVLETTLKCAGFHSISNYLIDGNPLSILFGSNSKLAKNDLDLWDYLQKSA